MNRRDADSSRNRDCRATWDVEVGDLALIYVYAPGRTGTAPGESKRQVAQTAQVIFDYAEDGTLLERVRVRRATVADVEAYPDGN